MKQPKVIFLDAVGTLFGIKGSVGEVYSAIAREFGVDVSPKTLDRAFFESFKSSPPLVFPGVDPRKISQKEYDWWRAIAKSTFTEAGILAKFSNFERFFAALYRHFATLEPWYVYPDVFPALKNWQQKGIQLGVISNFDTRLDQVLELLELTPFFSSITISSVVGAAKPDEKIFHTALKKHHCLPTEAWHIGDSSKEDYKGAKAVGIEAYWLQRDKKSIVGDNQLHNLKSLG